jgi:septal ring factor EnvC (AmiA/AmiB activator)
MTTKDHLARHDSHLEQVMTALAEAQVKTEEAQEELTRAMTALAKSHAETEAATRSLTRQWEAYLNTCARTKGPGTLHTLMSSAASNLVNKVWILLQPPPR